MTLYYNLLEKRMKDQPLPLGIPVFWTTPQKGEKEYNSPPVYVKPQEIKTPIRENHYKGPRSGGVKVTTQSVIDCANNPVEINALHSGVIAKIPVLLAELTIQLNVNSIIDLPEPALEIKHIKRSLKINQCVFLHNTNILYIKGLVRKNIEYAAGNCENADGSCGGIRHCIVEVPFNSTTSVTFNGIEPAPLDSSKSSEFHFLKRPERLPGNHSPQDEPESDDFPELNQISTAFYNELPFCELTSSKIVEFYDFFNPSGSKGSSPYALRSFESIEEKMVIYLSLKIMQYRKVAIHT